MGQKAIYRCNSRGNEFEAREGGGGSYYEYRCLECDTVKEIVKGTCPLDLQDIGKCPRCGGELKNNIKPMCTKCKSRNVEVKEVLEEYD